MYSAFIPRFKKFYNLLLPPKDPSDVIPVIGKRFLLFCHVIVQGIPGFRIGPVPGFSVGQLEAWNILSLVNEDANKSLIPRPVIKALRTHQKAELQYCINGPSSKSPEKIISDLSSQREGQMHLTQLRASKATASLPMIRNNT